MHDALKSYAHQYIRDGMSNIPEEWHVTFKNMYGRKGGKRSLEDAQKMTIDEVLLEIPDDKLDWVMQQIDASIRKLESTRVNKISID